MKLQITGRSEFFTMTLVLLLGLFSMNLLAQEKGEDKSKLDQLKGKVEKITVKVDGKDVVFEGDDAQKMADRLKSEKRTKIFSSGDLKEMEDGDGNVMVFKYKGRSGDFVFKKDGGKKKINVEIKDGKKVVSITTMKDGKEETKTYEGDEAEKFLKEEKGMKHISLTMNDEEDMPKDHMIYFKGKMGNKKMKMRGGCGCCGMEKAPMHGKVPHKMMMEKMDCDKKDSDVIIEKKIEKKIQKETEKK